MDRGENTIAIGSDHAGYRLKERLKGQLSKRGYEILDVGTDSEESCDYPDMAIEVAGRVSRGEVSRGVLICGTGVGMGMAANKMPGVRAAVCNDVYCARYGRMHNDANVITIGARVLGEDEARVILDAFLETDFEGDQEEGNRHVRRLEKLGRLEGLSGGTGDEAISR